MSFGAYPFGETPFGVASAEAVDPTRGAATGFHNTVFGPVKATTVRASGTWNTSFGSATGFVPTIVKQSLGTQFAQLIARSFGSQHQMGGEIALSFGSQFSVGPAYPEVRSSFGSQWLTVIQQSFGTQHQLYGAARRSFGSQYANVGQIGRSFGSTYDIPGFSTVAMSFGVSWAAISPGAMVVEDDVLVTVDDLVVPLLSCDLSADEGSSIWEATCVLREPGHLKNFPVNQPFTVIFGGELFSLVVDSRGITRSVGADGAVETTCTVYGRSPLIKYARPRAPVLTKTWEAATAASAIAEELVPGVIWEIVDWVVGANDFGVENSSAYQALSRLAEAAGGLVESDPDGTVRVRYRHPVSVAQYGPTIISHTLSDADDNFGSSEKYSPNVLVDILTISDDQQQGQAADRAEFELDSGETTVGTLRVYPQVWRDYVSARSTGELNVGFRSVVQRTESETLEFVAGQARTRFPVDSIQSTEWLTTNLGAVLHPPYASELTASNGGYSLAKITYTTKAHEFWVNGKQGAEAQIVIGD